MNGWDHSKFCSFAEVEHVSGTFIWKIIMDQDNVLVVLDYLSQAYF